MSKYVDGINEEGFDLFLKDLRSGDYKQGRSPLHVIDRFQDSEDVRFCCLGVACVRPAAEGVVSTSSSVEEVSYQHIRYDGYNTVNLPLVVADYLGIPEENRLLDGADPKGMDIAFFHLGYVHNNGHTHGFTAIGLNDRYQNSFIQIADAFEREFTKEA